MKRFCLTCNTNISAYKAKVKYCSNKCQTEFQYISFIKKWKSGEEVGWKGETRQLSNYIRKYMLEKYQYKCHKCSWDRRHPADNRPLVEINHIDGNAENCVESNLEVLCPNCHSMTPNFRARNRESKRKRKPDSVSGKPAVL